MIIRVFIVLFSLLMFTSIQAKEETIQSIAKQPNCSAVLGPALKKLNMTVKDLNSVEKVKYFQSHVKSSTKQNILSVCSKPQLGSYCSGCKIDSSGSCPYAKCVFCKKCW
jgi:hypothetical protein